MAGNGSAKDLADGGCGPVRPPGRFARLFARRRAPWWGTAGVGAVALAVVLAVVLPGQSADAVRVVDPTATIAHARAIAPYPLEVPAGLGGGWKVTDAAVYDMGGGQVEFRLGYAAPDGEYVALVERNTDDHSFISLNTGAGSVASYTVIRQQLWVTMQSVQKGQNSLVFDTPDVTVIVSGVAKWKVLRALAASLQPPLSVSSAVAWSSSGRQ